MRLLMIFDTNLGLSTLVAEQQRRKLMSLKNAYFSIPKNAELLIKLMEKIPPSWWWFEGELNAPDSKKALNEVADGVNVHFKETGLPCLSGKELGSVLCGGKIPSKIFFTQEVGWRSGLEPWANIARYCIQQDYTGELYFFHSCVNESGGYNTGYRPHQAYGGCAFYFFSDTMSAEKRKEKNRYRSVITPEWQVDLWWDDSLTGPTSPKELIKEFVSLGVNPLSEYEVETMQQKQSAA